MSRSVLAAASPPQEKPSAAANVGSGAAGPDYDKTNRQCATGKCNTKKFDTTSHFLVVWLKEGSGILASVQALRACTSCIGTAQRSTKHCQCRNDSKRCRRFARYHMLSAQRTYSAQRYTAPSAAQRAALHSAQHYTAPSATQGRMKHYQQSGGLGWPPTAV